MLAASRIDPDGTRPDDERKRQDRSFNVIDLADGWAKLSGRLTPSAAAALRAVLGPLSAPSPAEDGTRDERSAAQRRHDGLADACDRLLRSGTLPDSGGAATTVLVTIGYRDLLTRYHQAAGETATGADLARGSCGTPDGDHEGAPPPTGYGTTSYGTLIPVAELLRRTAEAEIIPVVLDDAGGVMAYGRSRRLASPAQRRALAARDRGCVRPGCTVPAEWCEVHHATAWQDGGATDLDNLALACGQHHRDLDRGATITMIAGVPHWTEPPYLDPRQVPRQNTTHHIPRLFEQASAFRRSADP
ncbi:MAG: HNH endonuclease [Jatrophihabitans sp.]|nr:MAG: HNH endonuclease [Jatrophihabitans sp.]